MKRYLLIAGVLGLFTVSSCKRSEVAEPKITNLDDIVVPEGFTWENSREVTFSIGISDTRFQDAIHRIAIYDGDPSAGGAMIAGGAASLVSSFNVKVSLASVINTVYVVKAAPDGSEVIEKVELNGNNVSLSIGAQNITRTLVASNVLPRLMSSGSQSAVSSSQDCSTGCTTTITTSTHINSNNDNEVVCITGSNITVSLNINGGTVRICGSNVLVSDANLNNTSKLIIAPSASVTFNNLSINGSSSSFENYGTVTVNGSFSPGGIASNNGTLTVKNDFNLNSGSTFTNNGILNIAMSMNVNTSNVSLNTGKIITGGDFKLNGGSRFINNCSLWIKNQFHNNSEMKNYGLIKVDNETVINGGSVTALYNGAMLKTVNMMMNGMVTGSGATSLIKVSARTVINGGAGATGAIQYCDQNGIETNYGSFSNGAAQGCSLYIPVTACNSEGNGVAPVKDSDGDGAADAIDAYPDDALRAFNNYYPSNSASAASTLAFEDRWPLKGDYDLNDIIISYRYNIITNAQNNVVQVSATYNLHATGGTYQNGFGVEFPLNRSDIGTLTGGTLEAGQTKAVVILFNNSRNEQNSWNTRPEEALAAVKTYTVNFNVQSRPPLSSFGLGSYNPFIWHSNLGRGYETHLAGKTPTSLANAALFGTGDDRTGSGKYYVTEKGHPWAVDVPQSSFNYPIEGVDISRAYPNFVKWAGSGGVSYTDWFSNTAQGYRDNSLLFLK
ncbi:LruC domain-containing protein [Arcticibacter tournemirensis]